MAHFRAELYATLDVTHITKNGVRNSSVIQFDNTKTYRLLAGKTDTLFYVDIVQPTSDSTDIAFVDAIPNVPSDISTFTFALLAF